MTVAMPVSETTMSNYQRVRKDWNNCQKQCHL